MPPHARSPRRGRLASPPRTEPEAPPPSPVEAPADALRIRLYREPLPAVILPRRQPLLVDVSVPGLAVRNTTARPVQLRAFTLSLLAEGQPQISTRLQGCALAAELARGYFISQSKLWRDVILRAGFVEPGVTVGALTEVPPGAEVILSGLAARLAASARHPLGGARLTVEYQDAAGQPQRAVRDVPLASPAVQKPYSFPLRGVWQVLNWNSPDGHRRSNFTHFAEDYVRPGPDGTLFRRRPPRRDADTLAHGATVHAPADGVVVAVQDGIPDNGPGKRPTGAAIAEVGNGRNGDYAPLHFQVMDGPDLSASTLQLQFDDLFDEDGAAIRFVFKGRALVHQRAVRP